MTRSRSFGQTGRKGKRKGKEKKKEGKKGEEAAKQVFTHFNKRTPHCLSTGLPDFLTIGFKQQMNFPKNWYS